MTKKYRMIDHTADFGIHVFGKDAADLFGNAALALFDLLTDIRAVKGKDQQKLIVTGSDWPDLMVNWLRELLYLWNGNGHLVKAVKIQTIRAFRINAILSYDGYDPDRHVIKNEIKAVTYHQIQVTRSPRDWQARILFDV